jgi:hypothetical protein
MNYLTRRCPKNHVILWGVYGAGAVLVSLLKWANGFNQQGYTSYENYRIFRNAFLHLWQGVDIYAAFPQEQWDLFKYSPAFALFMAPFSFLGDGAGLCFWNLCNALPLLYALLSLPFLTSRQATLCAWLVLPELVISMQNSQSNGLTAALLLLAWGDLERHRSFRPAGWIMGSAFIKLFGGMAILPGILYPQWKRFGVAAVFWLFFLAVLPLLFLPFDYGMNLYQWWFQLLQNDHAASVGLSVQGWLWTWWQWSPPKMAVSATGMGLLMACIWSVWRDNTLYRRVVLWCSFLLWVVIFNHKAESPTFVIALCGAAVWYVSTRSSHWVHLLFWTVFAFASLSPTDLFPTFLRKTFVEPFVLKAFPCILLWIIFTFALLCKKNLFGSALKE